MLQSDDINLDKDDLDQFFIHHLDKIYAAKTLLISELPQLIDNAHFSDLRDAMHRTIDDVRGQILNMEKIYRIMRATASTASSLGLKGLLKDSFKDITNHSSNAELRDMSILFYLHNIESIEMASFQILEMVGVKLKNDQIKRLLRENYEQAKADRTLYLLISAKYIASV
nr:DUF892 family protein [uncultured Dyadobacter sp.]